MTPGPQDSLKKQTRNILAFIAVVLFLFILKACADFILPIVIAFFIFVFVNPLLSRMDRLKIPRLIPLRIAICIVIPTLPPNAAEGVKADCTTKASVGRIS